MKQILNLLVANRDKALSGFRADAAPDGTEATVYLYSPISEWYFDPAEWCQAFAALTAETIHLRVNSPGGDVFVARTMAAVIAGTKAQVIAHVDGYALSAASFLLMSCDEIEMGAGSMLMIHDPWTICCGDGDDMRSTADVLDKIGQSIAADYVARTGLSVDEIAALMEAETWFSADEAVAKGFADRVAQTAKAKQDTVGDWDLTAYANAPRRPERTDPDTAFAALDAARTRASARLRLYERLGA